MVQTARISDKFIQSTTKNHKILKNKIAIITIRYGSHLYIIMESNQNPNARGPGENTANWLERLVAQGAPDAVRADVRQIQACEGQGKRCARIRCFFAFNRRVLHAVRWDKVSTVEIRGLSFTVFLLSLICFILCLIHQFSHQHMQTCLHNSVETSHP